MIGEKLRHYCIVEKIGAGGMGEVYRARDERLERDVALKLLPAGTLADESARKRFRKEALTLSKLNHPHIATVFDFDSQDGLDFIVMELVAGESLADKLAAGPLPEKDMARLGEQMAAALEEAHEHGIIHRDLKPANIRLTPKGLVKILDFGIARLLQPAGVEATTQSFAETQSVAGTLPYMAPEQLLGETVDARSDLYSLGVVLYEMATGQRPFQQKIATALSNAILHQPPPSPRTTNPRLSPGVENVILKCLEKEPGNRYQSAKELAVDLRRLSMPSAAPTPSPQAPAWGWSLRRPLPVAAVVTVVLLVVLALNLAHLRRWLAGAPAPGEITSIAVLPLANLSGDPEQEYFADGMTEALITDLGKISALRVISRTSVMQYKGTKKPVQVIARELNVDAVVEGTVTRSGSRVRVTANLIQAAPERHLWAESYERDLQNILALQGEVGRAIAQEVSVQLTPQEKTRLAEVRSVNPGAYEEYLKGLFFWNKRTPEGLEKAIEHFQRANEIAPAYPPPYAYLADSYALQGKVKLAQETAEKALALDSELPEAHMALAGLGVDKDPEKRFKRALAVAPNLAILHHRYSVYLNLKRRYQEAVQEAQRARELDPLSLVINANLAGQLDSAGKYDEALAQAKRTIELDPNFPYGHSVLGEICVNQGRYDEAIAEFKTAQALGAYPAGIRGNLGYVYALSGKREEAQRIINELKVLSESNPSSFYALAVVYAGLKDKDRTLYWLKRSVIAGMAGPHLAATDRRLAVIHSDPRFQELLRIVESSR